MTVTGLLTPTVRGGRLGGEGGEGVGGSHPSHLLMCANINLVHSPHVLFEVRLQRRWKNYSCTLFLPIQTLPPPPSPYTHPPTHPHTPSFPRETCGSSHLLILALAGEPVLLINQNHKGPNTIPERSLRVLILVQRRRRRQAAALVEMLICLFLEAAIGGNRGQTWCRMSKSPAVIALPSDRCLLSHARMLFISIHSHLSMPVFRSWSSWPHQCRGLGSGLGKHARVWSNETQLAAAAWFTRR